MVVLMETATSRPTTATSFSIRSTLLTHHRSKPPSSNLDCRGRPRLLPLHLSSPLPRRAALRARRSSFPPRRPVSAAFERFTERAIKAVVFSQREAMALGKDMVFTQHLLLGLIAEDRWPGGYLGSGLTVDLAREVVRSIWKDHGAGPSVASAAEIPFSISSQRVFEAAVEYSRSLGYNFIGPEHISIGLFTVDDGSAGRVLER